MEAKKIFRVEIEMQEVYEDGSINISASRVSIMAFNDWFDAMTFIAGVRNAIGYVSANLIQKSNTA